MASASWLSLIVALGLTSQLQARAQSDNFDDGNDTAAPAWSRYQPLAVYGAPGTWSFPGGNSYRIQAAASPAPGSLGGARAASTLPNAYTDFYVAVDLLAWDDTLDQAMGVMARLQNVGLGTTTGYIFTYQSDHHVSITKITGEAPSDLSGSASFLLLDATRQYRLVFMGSGTNFEGRIYDLTDLVTPLIIVTGHDDSYPNGICGLLSADNSSGSAGPADATFDNYLAAARDPQLISDNFDDQNDVGWTHFTPGTAGPGTPLVQTFTFPANPESANNYGYKITCTPQLTDFSNPGRVGSFRADDGTFEDFYVSADLIDWDNGQSQEMALMARITMPITTPVPLGYALVYRNRNSARHSGTDQLRIYKFVGSTFTFIHDTSGDLGQFCCGSPAHPGAADSPVPSGNYRLIFKGVGPVLTGQIIDLSTGQPLLVFDGISGLTDHIQATDSIFPSGKVGVYAFQETAPAGAMDPTFDNFFSATGEPKLSVELTGGNFIVTWPVLSGLWLLQSTPSLEPPVTWTTISTGITHSGLTNTYIDTAPTANMFYRLVGH